MIQIKQYILTLVALLALTMQAWAADELSESLTTNTSQTTYSGEHFTITGQRADAYGFYIVGLNDAMQIPNTVTISSKNGENITRIEAVIGYLHDQWNNNDNIVSTSGDVTGTYSEGQTLTISPVNATTVTLSSSQANYHLIEIKTWKIYYTPPPFPFTWSAATPNTASIAAMPAGNVEVNVEYYPQAALTTVPSAKSGVKATTDDDIISAGTVAAIGSTETKQGTLLYYVSETLLTEAELEALTDADWSADVPKATDLSEGNVYVYYYVKGNVGQTDETIFSDGDYNDQQVLNAPIAVEIGEAPTYAVRLNTEGLDAEEAAKWKAAKGDDNPAAFPLKGVKRYDDITVTYTGTRKVIGVKAEKKVTPILDLSTISGSSYTVTDDVILTGTPSANLEITVNGNCEITLDNVNPSGTKHIVIDVPSNNLNIKLKGTSRLKRLILSEALAIDEAEADGTVIVFSEYIPLKGSTVTINGGTVKAKSTNNGSFAVLGNLTVNGGNVYIATNNGQAVNGTVTVGTGVTLYESDGSTWGTITSGSETNMPYLSTDNSTDPSQWTW